MIQYRDEERSNVVNVVASTRVAEELEAVQFIQDELAVATVEGG
jgi:hypothetical protein